MGTLNSVLSLGISLILSCVIGPSVYMFQPQVFEYVAITYLLSLKLHTKASIKIEKVISGNPSWYKLCDDTLSLFRTDSNRDNYYLIRKYRRSQRTNGHKLRKGHSRTA
jgi:hypothetical protein